MQEETPKLNVETPQQEAASGQPVVCLGQTFPNDEARREHYIEKLREHLRDPKFRELEGFPLGSDEAILNLSDPPYYTVCPNPWLAEFVRAWGKEKPAEAEQALYHREPFAADVSEGKFDPVYRAHPYHTKVPHKAVMRFLLHYTEPGDIVYDGFCGTGMTGVAAQMCGDRAAVEALGYQVKPDGTILQQEEDTGGTTSWRPFSKLGVRKAVLSELSPGASLIAYTYNTPIDVTAFQQEAARILQEVEAECGWMYETLHTDGETRCQINHIIWSDVFVCPECTGEIVFWDTAVDKQEGVVKDEFPCPECAALLTKRRMERAWESFFDTVLNETVRQSKQVPVLIHYTYDGKRMKKRLESTDFELMNRIRDTASPYWFPTARIPKGDETKRLLRIGITNTHHFYTKRNLITLAAFKAKIQASSRRYLNWFTSVLGKIGKGMQLGALEDYFKNDGGVIARLSGILYIASLSVEVNVIERFALRTGRIRQIEFRRKFRDDHAVTACVSATHVAPADNSIDYIFLDPPFGSNLWYSELNFLMESWLGVLTDNTEEAIENKTQGKSGPEYRQLMNRCFLEAYRILKPGHWMTVEFSNTKASVWNNIQTALTGAGFIVANVAILDKGPNTFKASISSTAVKRDLVISAYKPNGGFEARFQKEARSEERVWDFVRTHLGYLSVVKKKDGLLQPIPERDARLLFDQMVAYYVRHMHFVPLSSSEFQLGLEPRFMERDGMFFLPNQGAEYDRQKMLSGGVQQRDLFVFDEASAIEWLRQLLRKKPQTFADINPQFMQELGGWSKNEVSLDLSELLSQNFLCYDGKGPVPDQIHVYLANNWKEFRQLPEDDSRLVKKAHERWYVPNPNKASDLEQLREKALLKEFEAYKAAKKKLRVFRAEAVRAGFKRAWQTHDYATILAVARKIPPNVLEEDAKLIMWYDQATTRTESTSHEA